MVEKDLKNVDLVFSSVQDYSFINLFKNDCVKLNEQNTSILWNQSEWTIFFQLSNCIKRFSVTKFSVFILRSRNGLRYLAIC